MYIDTPPGQVVDVSMCYDVVTSTKSPCLLCLLHFVLVPKTIRHTCYVDKKFTLQNTTCRDSQGHCITIATNIILAQIISSPSTSLLLYCPKLKILSQMYMYASYSARVFIDTSHHAYFTTVDNHRYVSSTTKRNPISLCGAHQTNDTPIIGSYPIYNDYSMNHNAPFWRAITLRLPHTRHSTAITNCNYDTHSLPELHSTCEKWI